MFHLQVPTLGQQHSWSPCCADKHLLQLSSGDAADELKITRSLVAKQETARKTRIELIRLIRNNPQLKKKNYDVFQDHHQTGVSILSLSGSAEYEMYQVRGMWSIGKCQHGIDMRM